MGGGNDSAFGGDGGDTLYGGTGADSLNGDAGNDSLFGGSGGDTLNGGDGADVLNGGSGDDTLRGGAGRDTLIGSVGNDVFDFNAPSDSGPAAANRDVINGSNNPGGGAGDVIDLFTIDANTGINGNQAFNFLGVIQNPNPPATAAGSLWLRNEGGDTVVYATVNAGDAPELAIRIADGGVNAGAYSGLDFVL